MYSIAFLLFHMMGLVLYNAQYCFIEKFLNFVSSVFVSYRKLPTMTTSPRVKANILSEESIEKKVSLVQTLAPYQKSMLALEFGGLALALLANILDVDYVAVILEFLGITSHLVQEEITIILETGLPVALVAMGVFIAYSLRMTNIGKITLDSTSISILYPREKAGKHSQRFEIHTVREILVKQFEKVENSKSPLWGNYSLSFRDADGQFHEISFAVDTFYYQHQLPKLVSVWKTSGIQVVFQKISS